MGNELFRACGMMSAMLGWQCLFLLSGFYFFSTVGEALFAGDISRNNQGLNSTSYAQNDYFALNMDYGSSSMVTLFALLVRNNWNMFVDGYIAASNKAVATWIFFVTVYVMLDLVRFN